MGSSEKEKFVIEKSGDALNYPSSSISPDWRFGGGNLTSPSHLVPPENYSASSSLSTAMVDSFSSTVWDHPSSQNLGFCSNNIQTSASTSKVIAPRNTSRDSLRSEDMEKLVSVGWNNPNLIPRCGGFLQSGAGLLPHSLSQVPMDSAFIERAARLSCFGDFSNMTNPFSISQSFNHFTKSGVVQSLQTLHVQSSSGLNVSGEQFQKNDSRMAEVVKDGVPLNHEAMEDRLQKNGGETGGFYRPSDEGKHGIGDPCNGSEEAEFSGSAQEELSVMEKVVGEPLAQALSVKKRKRSNKDVELEQGKGSPQLSAETVKENDVTKEKGEQNVTSVMTTTSKKHSKDSYQNSDAPKQDYIHVRARRGQATNSHSLAERVRREKISERMKFLQDLVPGCNKVTGKAVMLDEIINYVQSLQRQVEFLSMKLATVNPQLDFEIEELLSKDIFQSHGRTPSTLGFLPNMGITHPQLHPFQQGLVQAGIPSIGNHSDMLRRTISSPLTTLNGYKEPPLHQGHMIPMMDMARLFAKRGVISTIITTFLNAARFKPVIDRAAESGLPIRLIQLDFPWQEGGLPQGVENVDTIDSSIPGRKFLPALELLQEPIEQFLKEDHQPDPCCMISDFCLPWTYDIACKLHIPRITFHGTSSFSLLSSLNLQRFKPHEAVSSEFELFVLPGLPHKVEISKAQLQDDMINKGNSEMTAIFDRFREVDSKSSGVVINSFNELELEYVDYYKKAMGKKAWTIGPVSLCNKEIPDKAQRGNKAAIDDKKCLNWLDSKKPNSVIYACFGSVSRLTPAQLKEITLGLEASNQPFVLVIRKHEGIAEIEKWLSEGFEERVKNRGLIIRGWAPQTLILSHQAVGGFLTHCGWNSTLEGISAGVPLITWPQFGEQFLNEKLIVNVLRIGINIGVEAAVKWFEEEKNVLVKMEEVKKAVERLMGSDNEAEERRMRAKELGESARKTMEEGGSSYNNMTLFIEDIMEQTRQKME